MQEDLDEVTLAKSDDVETIVPGSTHQGHHDGHARCSLLEYAASEDGPGVLRVTYSHGVRTYRISPDQWESLKAAAPSSPGRWLDANVN